MEGHSYLIDQVKTAGYKVVPELIHKSEWQDMLKAMDVGVNFRQALLDKAKQEFKSEFSSLGKDEKQLQSFLNSVEKQLNTLGAYHKSLHNKIQIKTPGSIKPLKGLSKSVEMAAEKSASILNSLTELSVSVPAVAKFLGRSKELHEEVMTSTGNFERALEEFHHKVEENLDVSEDLPRLLEEKSKVYRNLQKQESEMKPFLDQINNLRKAYEEIGRDGAGLSQKASELRGDTSRLVTEFVRSNHDPNRPGSILGFITRFVELGTRSHSFFKKRALVNTVMGRESLYGRVKGRLEINASGSPSRLITKASVGLLKVTSNLEKIMKCMGAVADLGIWTTAAAILVRLADLLLKAKISTTLFNQKIMEVGGLIDLRITPKIDKATVKSVEKSFYQTYEYFTHLSNAALLMTKDDYAATLAALAQGGTTRRDVAAAFPGEDINAALKIEMNRAVMLASVIGTTPEEIATGIGELRAEQGISFNAIEKLFTEFIKDAEYSGAPSLLFYRDVKQLSSQFDFLGTRSHDISTMLSQMTRTCLLSENSAKSILQATLGAIKGSSIEQIAQDIFYARTVGIDKFRNEVVAKKRKEWDAAEIVASSASASGADIDLARKTAKQSKDIYEMFASRANDNYSDTITFFSMTSQVDQASYLRLQYRIMDQQVKMFTTDENDSSQISLAANMIAKQRQMSPEFVKGYMADYFSRQGRGQAAASMLSSNLEDSQSNLEGVQDKEVSQMEQLGASIRRETASLNKLGVIGLDYAISLLVRAGNWLSGVTENVGKLLSWIAQKFKEIANPVVKAVTKTVNIAREAIHPAPKYKANPTQLAPIKTGADEDERSFKIPIAELIKAEGSIDQNKMLNMAFDLMTGNRDYDGRLAEMGQKGTSTEVRQWLADVYKKCKDNNVPFSLVLMKLASEGFGARNDNSMKQVEKEGLDYAVNASKYQDVLQFVDTQGVDNAYDTLSSLARGAPNSELSKLIAKYRDIAVQMPQLPQRAPLPPAAGASTRALSKTAPIRQSNLPSAIMLKQSASLLARMVPSTVDSGAAVVGGANSTPVSDMDQPKNVLGPQLVAYMPLQPNMIVDTINGAVGNAQGDKVGVTDGTPISRTIETDSSQELEHTIYTILMES